MAALTSDLIEPASTPLPGHGGTSNTSLLQRNDSVFNGSVLNNSVFNGSVLNDSVFNGSVLNDSVQDDIDHDYYDLVRHINFALMGIVINIGIICNIIAFVVFMTSRILRQTSTGNFLMSLTIADFLFLTGELLRWLHSTHSQGQYTNIIDIMYTSDFVCKGVYFLRYGSKLTSAWLTVAITGERFITVALPIRVSQISTIKTARVVILLTYAACFVLGSYPFWTVGRKDYMGDLRCLITDYHAYNAWSWVVLRVGSLLLPGLVMLILTGLLIHFLMKAKTKRKRDLQEGIVLRNRLSHDIEGQLTAMLLSVAVAFLVLRLPYTILFYINEFQRQNWLQGDEILAKRVYFATRMSDVLATTNYAVNFFLYCMCGSTFRKQFKLLLRCKWTNGEAPRRRRSFTLSTLISGSLRRFSSGSGGRRTSSLEREQLNNFGHRLSNGHYSVNVK